MAVQTYYKFLMRRPGETYGRSYNNNGLEAPGTLWEPGTVFDYGKQEKPIRYGPGVRCFDTLAAACGHHCPGAIARITVDDTDIVYNGSTEPGFAGFFKMRKATVLDYVAPSTVQAAIPLVSLSVVNAPVNPLLVSPGTGLDLLGLLKKWAAVRTLIPGPYRISSRLPDQSVHAGIFWGVYNWVLGRPAAANIDTTTVSTLDAVNRDGIKNNSIADAAAAYAGGMFPGVTDWGLDPAALPSGVTASDPFRPLLTLWNAG